MARYGLTEDFVLATLVWFNNKRAMTKLLAKSIIGTGEDCDVTLHRCAHGQKRQPIMMGRQTMGRLDSTKLCPEGHERNNLPRRQSYIFTEAQKLNQRYNGPEHSLNDFQDIHATCGKRNTASKPTLVGLRLGRD